MIYSKKIMGKDIKILIASLFFTFLLIVGLSAVFSNKKEEVLSKVSGVEISPENYDLGDVPINGGLVTKEYEIKNTSGDNLRIKKITTSCMCTEAKVVIGDKETNFYGMEHPTDKNPPLNMELNSQQTAKVIVSFDPAAHGPEGIGPFDRIVFLTFTDPAGVAELTFEGDVVSQ